MTQGDSTQDYLHPYRLAVAAHGAGFAATLWGSERAQVLRFDIMIDRIDFRDAVIVDAGCGQGDFAARLLERQVPFARLIGLDAMDPMVAEANDRGLDRSRFETVDVVANDEAFAAHSPDWVCFSGTLNTMDDKTARALLTRAWSAARIGVAFNFLSDRPAERWRERDLTPARRFDTLAWIEWALALSPKVTFDQSYLDGHDATIIISRVADESA